MKKTKDDEKRRADSFDVKQKFFHNTKTLSLRLIILPKGRGDDEDDKKLNVAKCSMF
jgi:hypothetical protein